MKQLEPKGQDKIELFDYLTNTMSLEILKQNDRQETRMFPASDGSTVAKPKFLTVRATKQKVKGGIGNPHPGGGGQHINKSIKLELVDHSKDYGIPY